MKRLVVIAMALIVGVTLWRPATSQDNYEERIASLETRVSVVEGTVRNLRPTAIPANDLTVEAETYTITGTLRLYGKRADVWVDVDEDDCGGLGGYDDLNEGVGVTVRDQRADIIATGEVVDSVPPDGVAKAGYCDLEFEVEDVPAVDFYAVEVSHRGELDYSFDDLEEMDWQLEFVIEGF